METRLQRCVPTDNSETGRSLMAKSNHRIYRKELQKDWNQCEDALPIFSLAKGSFVAMKQFCGSDKKKLKEICQKEFNILLDCKHDNVIKVLEIVLDVEENNPASLPVFFMELGECSLEYLLTLKRGDTLPEEFAYPTGDHGYSWRHCISWLRQIAGAMAYLHDGDKPVVHRDLKCSNVILFNGKTLCKVCDFDMSRYYNPEGMTVDIGTWRWMAPEVRSVSCVETKQRYSIKVDCYSFGVLICETIFRQRPFSSYADKIFTNLEIPNTPLVEDNSLPTEGAMTLRWEGNSIRVQLNRERAHFQLSDRMWKLTSSLLAWDSEERPKFGLVVSKLAIEEPRAIDELTGAELDPPPRLRHPDGDDELGHLLLRTDTGVLTNHVCPAIPSVSHSVKVLYSVELLDEDGGLTEGETGRLVEVLRTQADNVVSFYEDAQRDAATERQATDGAAGDAGVRCRIRATNSGRLELEISGADRDVNERVAGVCRGSGNDILLDWMAGLFHREIRFRRLQRVKFRVVNE